MTDDCCEGCEYCRPITDDYPSGCGNGTIDPDWCLNPNRPELKGIYFEKKRVE